MNFTSGGNISSVGFSSTTLTSSSTSTAVSAATTSKSTPISATTSAQSSATGTGIAASTQTPISTPSGPTSPTVAVIIGIVVAGVFLLLAAGALGWWFGYRRRKGKTAQSEAEGRGAKAKDLPTPVVPGTSPYGFSGYIGWQEPVHKVHGSELAHVYEVGSGGVR